MAEAVKSTYRAFLSYSHRDKAWATWLHRALEHAKIDKDLVGRETPFGPVPATLRPVFRDRDDFAAGHSLNEQTLAALRGSQFLVAICSPSAARSLYVNEEIRCFKAMGRADRIIPLIIDGEPGNPERECFAPALRFKLNPDGSIGTQAEEPIAADARDTGDGKQAALIKITAGLLGVRLDEVIRRAERARARHRRLWGALAGAFLMLIAGCSAALAWGYFKSLESDDWMDEVVRVASGFVSEATDMSERLGIPVDVPLALVIRADTALTGYIAKGKDSPKLRHRRAITLLSLAGSYAKLGQTGPQMERVQEARTMLEALVAADALNPFWRFDLAYAYTDSADLMAAQGAAPEDVLAQYRKGLTIRQALLKERPNSIAVQREITVSYERIADLLMEQNDLPGAAENVAAMLTVRERRASEAPDDLDRQNELAIAYSRAGDISERRGALTDATRHQRGALAIAKRLVAAKPNNTTFLRNLAIAHDALASTLVLQSDMDQAIPEFEASLAVRQRLAAADPTNAIWQRDLSVSHDKIGNAHTLKGAAREAVDDYRAAYVIRERLAVADAKSTEARRDQIAARGKVAYALIALGNTEEALALYRENLAAHEKLLAGSPTDLALQREAAQTYEGIADLLVARRDYGSALEYYRKRLAILVPIAAASPTDSTLQRQLGYTHSKIGDAYSAQGAVPLAIESYRASLAIRAALTAANPSIVAFTLEMLFARWSLADLGDDAVRNMEETVATLGRLKTEGLLSPQQAALLPQAEARLAKLKL